MALEKQNISISLKQGIDTKTDPKQVVTGKMLLLQNATFQSLGRLKKRNGYAVLNSTIHSGNAIASFNDELVLMDGSNVYSYGAKLFDATIRGKKVACDISVDSIVRNSFQQTEPDSAIANGIICFAYQNSSGVAQYTLLDQVTKKVYANGMQIGTSATSVKVNALVGAIVISYIEGLTTLKALTINTSSFATSTISVGTFGTYNHFYDVSLVSGYLLYAFSGAAAIGGAPCIDVIALTPSLTLGTIFEIPGTTLQKSVFSDGSTGAYIAYNSGTAVQYVQLPAGFSSYTGPFTVETISNAQNITGIKNPTGPIFFYEILNSTGSTADNFVRVNQFTGGTAGTPSDLLRSVGLWSKPFIYSSKTYLAVAHESKLQSCYFVIDSSGSVITRIASNNGGGLAKAGVLREINSVSSNEVQFAYLIKDFVSSINGDVFTQTGLNSLNLTFGGPIVSQNIGNNLNLSGAMVSTYDGSGVVEKNFNLYPENISAKATPSGGGLATGSYEYCALYEWTDNKGQIHQSATSVPVQVDTTVNKIYNFAGYSSGSSLNPQSGTGWNYLTPGAQVTGSGIPAGTYIIQGTTQTNTSSSSAANTSFTATPGKGFTYSSTIGSSVITPQLTYTSYTLGSITTGSNILTLDSDYDLPTGTFIQYFDGSTTQGGYVTAKSGLSVTLSSSSLNTFSHISFQTTFSLAGSTTSGSAVFTKTGTISFDSTIIGRFINPSSSVVSISGNQITFSAPFTSTNASVVISFYLNQPVPAVGENYTDLGGNFSGTVTIKSISGSNITINQQASATSSSAGNALVSPSAQSGIIKIPTIRVTDKSSVSIAIYRTLLNQTIFYRVSSFSVPITNDKTIDSISFVDTAPDSIIIGNEQLYTTGDVVSNLAPPPSSISWSYKNRSMIVPSENTRTIWYSKPAVPGVSVEFSDSFVQNVPEEGGPITAGAQLDDKCVIFKEGLTFIMVGDGPNNTGTQNDFSDPQKIASDTGCINQKSVILIPTGLMYQSAKGIYLLDRSLNATYIGHDVESYNARTITSSNIIRNLNQVRFSLLNTSETLVYDYLLNEWSVFNNPEVADSCIYKDLYTYIISSGYTYQETPGVFLDGPNPILLSLKSSWLSFASLQGFQRAYKMLLLGEYVSPHSLVLNIAYDFQGTYNQTVTIPVTSSPSGAYQYRVFFKIQKCEAIQITLSEQQTAPYGEGLSLSAFALEVGAKKGLDKLPSGQSYG